MGATTSLAAQAGSINPRTDRIVPRPLWFGDCISIDGQALRFIEPIGRQAQLIASHLTGGISLPYVSKRLPVRVKTASKAFTV